MACICHVRREGHLAGDTPHENKNTHACNDLGKRDSLCLVTPPYNIHYLVPGHIEAFASIYRTKNETKQPACAWESVLCPSPQTQFTNGSIQILITLIAVLLLINQGIRLNILAIFHRFFYFIFKMKMMKRGILFRLSLPISEKKILSDGSIFFF